MLSRTRCLFAKVMNGAQCSGPIMNCGCTTSRELLVVACMAAVSRACHLTKIIAEWRRSSMGKSAGAWRRLNAAAAAAAVAAAAAAATVAHLFRSCVRVALAAWCTAGAVAVPQLSLLCACRVVRERERGGGGGDQVYGQHVPLGQSTNRARFFANITSGRQPLPPTVAQRVKLES